MQPTRDRLDVLSITRFCLRYVADSYLFFFVTFDRALRMFCSSEVAIESAASRQLLGLTARCRRRYRAAATTDQLLGSMYVCPWIPAGPHVLASAGIDVRPIDNLLCSEEQPPPQHTFSYRILGVIYVCLTYVNTSISRWLNNLKLGLSPIHILISPYNCVML